MRIVYKLREYIKLLNDFKSLKFDDKNISILFISSIIVLLLSLLSEVLFLTTIQPLVSSLTSNKITTSLFLIFAISLMLSNGLRILWTRLSSLLSAKIGNSLSFSLLDSLLDLNYRQI